MDIDGYNNGRRVMELFAESGLCIGETYFKQRSFHKYTRMTMGQDGVEVKSMMDLVLVKNDMLHFVQNVRTVRGIGLISPCGTV